MDIDTCPRCYERLQKVKCKSGFYYRHNKSVIAGLRVLCGYPGSQPVCLPPEYTIDELIE
jgi:hypothetical protein